MSQPMFKIGDKFSYLDKEKNRMSFVEIIGVSRGAETSYICFDKHRTCVLSEEQLIKNISGKDD